MMRRPSNFFPARQLLSFGIALLWLGALAQVTATEQSNPAPAQTAEESPKDLTLKHAVDLMLSERESEEKLEQAIRVAQKMGASEQAALEARFLFYIDQRNDKKIAALAPIFKAQRDRFKLDDSEIFAIKDDWLSVVEYVLAIEAAQNNDQEKFKKHITEAFWLSPQQGVAFAPHIERLRMEEAMKSIRIDFKLNYKTLNTGEPFLLGSVMDGSPALLLHFFSPWSRECEETLSDFGTLTKKLKEVGIPTVTMIGETFQEARDDTLELLKKLSAPPPGKWIIDNSRNPLTRQLRIKMAPTMILVSPKGEILFNGHPGEDEFWKKLLSVAPGFERPKSSLYR